MAQLQDLLSEFVKLSEETDVVEAEHEVARVSERLSDLNDRLSTRRSLVTVFELFWYADEHF